MHVTPLWEQVLLFRNKSPIIQAQKNPKRLTWSGFGCYVGKIKKLENRRFLQNDLFQLGPKRAGLQPIEG
jgi:hypothetical protein